MEHAKIEKHPTLVHSQYHRDLTIDLFNEYRALGEGGRGFGPPSTAFRKHNGTEGRHTQRLFRNVPRFFQSTGDLPEPKES